ncbi:MAG: hypothetical protein Q9220_000369 [cf. Caloplaca sp. 1 TL-2023]
MVLMITQVFTSPNQGLLISHPEHASRLLKSRGLSGPQSDFERILLQTLRGPVVDTPQAIAHRTAKADLQKVFEALSNETIQFSPEEWKYLIGDEVDPTATDGKWFQCLAHIPELMKQCKAALNTQPRSIFQLLGLQYEARSLLDKCETYIKEFRDRMNRFIENALPGPLTENIKAHHLRTLGLGLSTGIILNCILGRLDVYDESLAETSSRWSEEINQLSEVAAKYRPLGALAMVLCLSMAWVGAGNPQTRQWSEELIVDYHRVCIGKVSHCWRADLEKHRKRFTLRD